MPIALLRRAVESIRCWAQGETGKAEASSRQRYTQTQSKYIRGLIDGHCWDDRDYVDALIEVERYLLRGSTGLFDLVEKHRLFREQQFGMKLLLLELAGREVTPELLLELQAAMEIQGDIRRALRRCTREKRERKDSRRIAALKSDWMDAGGLP